MLIGKLAAQSEFSPAQVEQLIEIPELNNQVGWVKSDPDVHEFYASLLDKYGKIIQREAAGKLGAIVYPPEPPKASDDDEVPF